MKPRSRSSIAAALLLAFVSASSQAQQPPNLILTVTGAPTGFSTVSATTCGSKTIPVLNNVLATEPLMLRFESTPTQVVPTPLVLRRLAAVVGVKNCASPVMVGQTVIPIDFSSMSPPPIVPMDSFSNPGDPVFGPPLLGPSVVMYQLATNYVVPVSAYPLHLIVFGVTEDLPGGSTDLVPSNAHEVVIVDPATGLAPTITGVTAPAGPCATGSSNASGPEAGGTPIAITGTRFPAHTNWGAFPPTVEVDTQDASAVVVHSQQLVTAVTPPSGIPTCPPATGAGPHDVTFRNNSALSPMGMPAISPIKFTYCSGRTPHVTSLDITNAHPEGGQLLTIDGTDFLHGADIIFTSQLLGTLTTTLSPDDSAIQAAPGSTCESPTGTTIDVTTPPFCSGPVSVQVVNPDGIVSTLATLDYATLDPTVASIAPTVTITGLAAPVTVSAMVEGGTTLTIVGTNFIRSTSPLFGAPTVPQAPGAIFPSRTDITGALGNTIFTSTSGVLSANTISVNAGIGDQSGVFRPNLGLRPLRVTNPACVSATPSAPFMVLIQDAAPPAVFSFLPNVVVQAAPGVATRIKIQGSNFFSRRNPTALPVTKAFNGPPTLDDIDVPAVSFGGTFAPVVELLSQTELVAEIPAGLAILSAVPITVFNPDGRTGTATLPLQIVPRLTNATTLTNPYVPVLDTAALLEIAYVPTNTFIALPDVKIVFVPNPTPNDDRIEDIANGGDPSVTGNPAAYDGVFLFNTRHPSGGARLFDFAGVDVPSTIMLPTPVVLGPTLLVTAGLKRVIFKAVSYTLNAALVPTFYLDQGYPLVLRSHSDLKFGGMLDVSGDAMVNQGVAQSPTLKFQYRCEWQLPSAGGGIGGRGGLHNELGLLPQSPGMFVLPLLASSLGQPSLGTPQGTLGGDHGYAPRERITLVPEPATWGRLGSGRAPFGGQGGGGGGGGHAAAGLPGQIGATPSPGAGGASFGNATNVPAGTPGRPAVDSSVYGATAADFDGPLRLDAGFPIGLFAGGSGGGGGGGSLALVVPCVSVGGRGGNGGGSVVLLSDATFKLGPYGRIHADGEKGLLGIDAFPFPNGEPLFVLCAPGSGGGGAGGMIFIAAVADVDLTAPVVASGQRILSAEGGLGGAPAGSSTIPTAHGGAGAHGRIRIAMNTLSSLVPQRQTDFQIRVTGMNILPSPGPVIAVPMSDFFRYPSP